MKALAVLFDVGGVLVSPPQSAIARYEKSLNLPKGVISTAFVRGAPYNAFCKLEIGELTISEVVNKLPYKTKRPDPGGQSWFLPLFEQECQSTADMFGVELPDSFSAKALFEEINSSSVFEQRMFQAAMKLKKNGYLVGVLTNNWIDSNEKGVKEFFSFLNHHFHIVVESCKEGVRKPDQAAFKIACERLKTDPHEVIFLDDLRVNVKAAQGMGMYTILVKDIPTALKQLTKVTGIDVYSEKENLTSKI